MSPCKFLASVCKFLASDCKWRKECKWDGSGASRSCHYGRVLSRELFASGPRPAHMLTGKSWEQLSKTNMRSKLNTVKFSIQGKLLVHGIRERGKERGRAGQTGKSMLRDGANRTSQGLSKPKQSVHMCVGWVEREKTC